MKKLICNVAICYILSLSLLSAESVIYDLSSGSANNVRAATNGKPINFPANSLLGGNPFSAGTNTIRSGAGVPSNGLGANGDFYINTTANTIYGPKAGGVWGSPTSLNGPTGAAGSNGANGAAGSNGGIKYTYSNDTANTDPTSGFLKFNSTTFASVNNLRISNTDADSNGLATFLTQWDGSSSGIRGIIIITKDSSPSNLLVYTITGARTDNTGWKNFPLTYITSSGSFTNSDATRIFFSRVGDKGDTGASGAGTGDFSTNTSSSVDNEMVLFSGTGGKTAKRATGTGIIKVISGVTNVAVSGTDYAPATSGSSVLKGNGAGGTTTATSGTDYAPATSGSAVLKGNGAGGTATATAGTDYDSPSSTNALINKTIDTAGPNTIKRFDYIHFPYPDNGDGTNALRSTTEGATYGHFVFKNSVAKASNYVIYRIEVPDNLNTAIDLAAKFKFRLTGADTGKHSYYISMADCADSASCDNPTFSNEIALSFASDASGASGDVETVGYTTLTTWKSSLTAGHEMAIKVSRDGSDGTLDTSTVDSNDLDLVIRYGISSTSTQ